jgi:hypothetical protein
MAAQALCYKEVKVYKPWASFSPGRNWCKYCRRDVIKHKIIVIDLMPEQGHVIAEK